MALNCKVGDMALVVGGRANVGKVVTCIELLPSEAHYVQLDEGPIWKVDRMMKFKNLFGVTVERQLAPDKCLLPIRPGDDVRHETDEPISERTGAEP